MDFCRNLSLSNGLPLENPLSPPYSMHTGTFVSMDDLFPVENTEGDVDVEWLSALMEDCLTSTGNCLPPPQPTEPTKPAETPKTSKPFDEMPKRTLPPSLQEFSIPGKARSKRRRPLTTPAHLAAFHVQTSHPLLLHQEHWLADSELIVPQKMGGEEVKEEQEEKRIMIGFGGGGGWGKGSKDKLGMEESGHGQARRCTHCLSQKTPQWRTGPLGPKTLCNACGVRFKSGRLLPEYRPAKSPTFSSYKHSNSHKKVMEMRMGSTSNE